MQKKVESFRKPIDFLGVSDYTIYMINKENEPMTATTVEYEIVYEGWKYGKKKTGGSLATFNQLIETLEIDNPDATEIEERDGGVYEIQTGLLIAKAVALETIETIKDLFWIALNQYKEHAHSKSGLGVYWKTAFEKHAHKLSAFSEEEIRSTFGKHADFVLSKI